MSPPIDVSLTVMLHVAFFPPSFVVTVIVAVPVAFAVTTPVEETVMIEVLLEDQVIVLLVALEGITVAVSVFVSPTIIDNDALFKLTPVTATVWGWTVTAQVAFSPPSFVVTVMMAEPAVFAVTTPEPETVATDVLLEDHVTDLSVALEGVTVAVKV